MWSQDGSSCCSLHLKLKPKGRGCCSFCLNSFFSGCSSKSPKINWFIPIDLDRPNCLFLDQFLQPGEFRVLSGKTGPFVSSSELGKLRPNSKLLDLELRRVTATLRKRNWMQGFITTPNALIIFIIFKLIQHLENESRNSRWGKRRRAVVLPLCPLLTLGTWADYNWFDLTFSRCKNEDIFLLPSSQVTMKNQKKELW